MLRNGLLLVLSILMYSCFRAIQPIPPEHENDYKLQVIHLVPLTYNYSQTNIEKAATTTLEVQRYMQAATGGKTFEILNEEDILDIYFSNRRLEDYEED